MKKRPAYYASLQTLLMDEEITALEKKYEVILQEDLKELYKWKNGQRDSYEVFMNNSMFVPLEQTLEARKELTSMGGVFTGRKGQLIEYWNDDNDRNVVSPDLLTLIKTLNKYYEKTPAEKFNEYFDISHQLSQFKKKFVVEKPLRE